VRDQESLRVGCVKYLNARPLIHGWTGRVTFDHPAVLCAQLARNELDVALVSSFEFFRNPIYRIVDRIAIGSAGPVYSVFVAHRGALSEIEEIELDPASATSVNLLRCLLAELKLAPDLTKTSAANVTERRARLIIGDQALHFRKQHEQEFHFWDLGEQWMRVVKRPFVYALWLVRPEVAHPEAIGDRLRALRDENVANLEQLAVAGNEFDSDFSLRYYREHLRFTLGEEEKDGLRVFQELCEKHGLLPSKKVEFNFV
jgi:predicted solute-binding protein